MYYYMIFRRKKKRMIDVGELARRGGVRKDNSGVPKFDTNKDGFVDFSKPEVKRKIARTSSGNTSGSDGMDFLNVGNVSSGGTDFSTEKDGYSKREVDERIQKLDNVIYKMEQRIELLERKAGVGNSSDNSSVGAMGW
jgi:hypothetical protein